MSTEPGLCSFEGWPWGEPACQQKATSNLSIFYTKDKRIYRDVEVCSRHKEVVTKMVKAGLSPDFELK